MFDVSQIDWDKKLVWSYPMKVHSTHSGWDIKDGISIISHQDKTVALGWCQDDLLETLMQFTGLLDKNKREIYEGDILIAETDWGLGFSKIIGKVEYQEPKAVFVVNGMISGQARSFHLFDCWEYEVIGNIYENKELLK